MIYSMTAFGRSQIKDGWGMAVWELRSINHRYLEITVRLPDMLRELEQGVREVLNLHFQRGKIECNLRFHPGAKLGSIISVNNNLLNQLIAVVNQASKALPENITRIDLIELLAWNGVVSEESFDIEEVRGALLTLFEEAAIDLKEGRKREGKALVQGIRDRLKKIAGQVDEIKKSSPALIKKQREKVAQRLEEAKINLDPQRLEQEMVYFVQKIDVSEEIDRTLSHIAEVQRTLSKGGSVGRRLDFMMQELNREANTLAAKSVETSVTHAAVEIKVLIEQIREQVQNIE